MSGVVSKLGGTTVACADSIRSTLRALDLNETRILVVSAPAGVTDVLCRVSSSQDRHRALEVVAGRFIATANALLPGQAVGDFAANIASWIAEEVLQSAHPRIVARGEIWNARLIAQFLASSGHDATWVDARKGIVVGKADARVENCFAHELKERQRIHVVTGFIARDESGATALLGRDGSDYTAALIAAATAATRVDFITSTHGIRSADPSLLGHDGVRIASMSYQQARLVAHLGGGVLHPRTIRPLEDARIPARVMRPGCTDQCTWIGRRERWPADGVGLFTDDDGVLQPVPVHLAQPERYGASTTEVEGQPALRWQGAPPNALLRNVHRRLYEDCETVDLILVGPGRIGRRVLELIAEKDIELRLRHRLHIRAIASIASHRAIWLASDEPCTSLEAALDAAENRSIVVDTTASAEIASRHATWLERGHDVVTANKFGLAGDLESARRLLAEPRYHPAATVGAGLPMITAIKEHALESSFSGVLSGSLNFLLWKLDQDTPFDHALCAAQAEGLMEPDPSADLSGEDVARKAIILARAAGRPANLEDVALQPLLSEVSHGHELVQRVVAARRRGQRLVYLASLQGSNIVVGPREIPRDDPLALGSADNGLLIECDGKRVCEIRGPGAGIEVTARNVVRDIVAAALANVAAKRPALRAA